ncbi:MAG: tyrosine-type recombinase/integrase [Deltaproteobacteria bacterium]|nr:tyrosine-type recombinase/integrase [Deltaproteobacteria bacterium]
MIRIQQAVTDYLELRRALGFKLEREGTLLPEFAVWVDAEGYGHISSDLALRWATQEFKASQRWGAKRLSMVRLFARYYRSIDTLTEVPPADLLPFKQQRQAPYIYSDQDIEALLAAAKKIRSSFSAKTHTTLLGLLSATGMRVGEAIALDRDDVDWVAGVLMVRNAKFGKSRLVPLHTTTLLALRRYSDERDLEWPTPRSPSFFVSTRGSRPFYKNVHHVFLRLLDRSGLAERTTPRRPRIHDLRHTFAVKTVLGWYRTGVDVETRMPRLSTYMGHVNPSQTYWYLTATPELLACAAQRLQRRWEIHS